MVFKSEADRSKFVEEKLPLVKKVVDEQLFLNGNIEDFYQIGCIGLLKAIDKYGTSNMNFILDENDYLVGDDFDEIAIQMITEELKRYMQ